MRLTSERNMTFNPTLLRQCRFLAGPTASGKSAAGLELAGLLGAEIVALDSMSLYRGMDIGTAKPDAAARERMPHHLLDIIDPSQEFSLAEYLERAEAVCRDIVARQRIPLFVGGTGLYLRAVLRGIFQGPPADWEYRKELEAQAALHGPDYLHALLREVDPPSAARLHPHDARRLIRALEVFRVTGIPLSAQQQEEPLPIGERPAHVYWLFPERDLLYARIDRRVEEMFAAGLVAEVRQLLAAERPLSRTARQALGYKEVIEHLAGVKPEAETIALIQQRTRQFAKRQHTWFRNLEECVPVPVTGHETPAEIAKKLFARGP